ncbi:AAA family ATPase, partial [Magnetococcales bacterium HHB-1]
MARIKRIKITKLFGSLDHDIILKEGGITFIHGPNGCGKTTILRLIDAFFSGRYKFFFEVRFGTLEIIFENKEIFEFSNISGSFNVNYYEKGALRNDSWVFARSPEGPYWLRKEKKGNINLIEAQRLFVLDGKADYSSEYPSRPEVTVAIRENARELAAKITKTLSEFATFSQQKEQSFPLRLLEMVVFPDIDDLKIREEYEKIEVWRERLKKTGLLDENDSLPLPDQKIDDDKARVLSLYIEDTKVKLSIFDGMLEKIEAFMDIVGAKMRGKRFSVNRESGFHFETLHDNTPIEIDQLSSGEQHQVNLFYTIIFKSSPGTLFL